MKLQDELSDFILKEWLLIASASSLALTSIYIGHFPVYSGQEIQVLYFLLVLLIAAKGLEHSGLILRLSQSIETGRLIPLKLVVATFFLSMVVTNDVALITIVPLTLLLNIERMDILIILEALAANAGSSLTPFGNPQNLFIYWFYQLSPTDFVKTIAPFSLLFLLLLVIIASTIGTARNNRATVKPEKVRISAYIHISLLSVVILAILHLLPFWIGFVVILYALLFERKSLRVDYPLLFTFFFLFGLSGNIKILLGSELASHRHVFLFSAATSQFMSNVPAALLLAKFTTQWKALLWGTNVGGFGSLIGSLANLIAYKLYIKHKRSNNMVIFTAKFLVFGYVAFFIGICLNFGLEGIY